jgi:hypothetical protein
MRPDADLTPPAVARLVAEVMDALDLRDVVLVGNDTGGGLCQLVVAAHPERLAGLVLVTCDAYEHFPPAVLRPAAWLGRAPAPLAHAVLRLLRFDPVMTAVVAPVNRRRSAARSRAWAAPVVADAGVRRDVLRFLAAMRPVHTLAAVAGLRAFDRPALVVWGRRARLFPVADGRPSGRRPAAGAARARRRHPHVHLARPARPPRRAHRAVHGRGGAGAGVGGRRLRAGTGATGPRRAPSGRSGRDGGARRDPRRGRRPRRPAPGRAAAGWPVRTATTRAPAATPAATPAGRPRARRTPRRPPRAARARAGRARVRLARATSSDVTIRAGTGSPAARRRALGERAAARGHDGEALGRPPREQVGRAGHGAAAVRCPASGSRRGGPPRRPRRSRGAARRPSPRVGRPGMRAMTCSGSSARPVAHARHARSTATCESTSTPSRSHSSRAGAPSPSRSRAVRAVAFTRPAAGASGRRRPGRPGARAR